MCSSDLFFSIFVDLEMVAKGIPSIIGFCFDYMPSSLEVVKPQEFHLQNKVISDMLNDLQAKLHKVDMIVKQLRNEGDFVKRNLNTALKNNITIVLKMKDRTKDELTRMTGMPLSELNKFLDQMVKDNEIIFEGKVYKSLK
mgnify:CR=1 FL=1